MTKDVVRCSSRYVHALRDLLTPYGLRVAVVDEKEPIPGSFWGDTEAGLVGHRLLVREDTPVHSALHEACHYICMDEGRRESLHTDAGGDYAEEGAVCCLQILLADALADYGRQRIFADMDAWGYSFRLGSSAAWFGQDAEDAKRWLIDHGVINEDESLTWSLRGGQPPFVVGATF